MVGFKKAEKFDSPDTEAPKYKRKKFLHRLGNYLSRAFHRTHRDAPSKRINTRQHSRSTGDLLNDVQSSSRKPVSTRERLQDHPDSRNPAISADDRANSVDHIDAVSSSSSVERPNPTYLPSAFREELNAKLRLGSGHGAPGFRGPAGTKSADSCGSLASNDSFLCPTSTTVSGDSAATSMTPSTHESHVNTVASPSSHHSATSATVTPNLAGMQHKLAVGRQHKRRPPTRIDQTEEVTGEAATEVGTSTPLALGCTQFFAGLNNAAAMSSSFTHSSMYLISEEGSSDASSKSSNNPQLSDTRTPHSEPLKSTHRSPVEATHPSTRHAPWVNRNHSVSDENAPTDSLLTPSNRPVSMFVASAEHTPIESQNHHHQRSSPGPTTGLVTENGVPLPTPGVSSRLKSRSISEQSQEGDVCTVGSVQSETSHRIFDFKRGFEQDQKSDSSCNRIPSTHSPLIPSKDNRPITESTSHAGIPSPKTPPTASRPTARPRSKFGAQLKTTQIPLSNDVPAETASIPAVQCSRPISMNFPPPPPYTSAILNRPPGTSTPSSFGPAQSSRSKSCSTSHRVENESEDNGVDPERTSVSDRAALFGAKLTSTKSQRSSSGVAAEYIRDKEKTDEHASTTNARPVSVFDLVRNFEQPH